MRRPVKFVTKAVTKVAIPQTSIIKDNHLAASVFFRMTLDGISNKI
jgi:hypothetical protein